ncbi:MAG TPA: trans-4-hydroxy-L-proline dehydratase [Vicinamibacterales bacterium]
MNPRVTRLRDQSLATAPWLSHERALLLTEFYEQAPAASVAMTRALAFAHLMEHKTIYIGDGELIVGERGPAPKGTPTYPELCCHTLEDLEVLHTREKISYRVCDEARAAYRDRIIPFWRGRSMRDLLFAQMTPAWKAAYDAGVFTEFMEQRAPGHTVLDGKIYRRGFRDFQEDIRRAIAALDDCADPLAYDKREELRAMHVCADAIIRFAERHAERALEMAAYEPDPARRAELERIAEVCTRVPAHAPRTFHEALQAYWFVHLGVITELNTWDAFNPGHLDQHLDPFYRAGLEDGSLTDEDARELLQCFWVKFNNQPAPPKVGVTAAESGTYTDFANINSGGLTATGESGVTDVTYLILDVIDEMRLLQPSSNIQVSGRNPDRFIRRACEIVRKGWGQPSMFNADAVVEELLRQGKSLQDARAGGTSGCVETGAFGKEAYWLTGYFNLPKVLELALNDGIDPVTGARVGIATGMLADAASFDDVFNAFTQQLQHLARVKMGAANVIERLYATRMPAPFLSTIIDDCIAQGRDYNAGGARYNTTYIMPVGIATVTDSLSAIREHAFGERALGPSRLAAAIASNFAGEEATRARLWNKTPRYGNDDLAADDLLASVFDAVYDAIDGTPNARGGMFHVNYLSTTCHVYFGSKVGATADGRHAGEPVSEGISPVQGTDRRGTTAVLRSAARMDHARTGGTLLNQKFSPDALATDADLDRLVSLVRSYFALGGHHIQFNVVTAATLREAQAHPEKHRDLIVRVAGYSDYFCDLTKPLQDEIVSRTEHSGV